MGREKMMYDVRRKIKKREFKGIYLGFYLRNQSGWKMC
jgi:hypothetical protein